MDVRAKEREADKEKEDETQTELLYYSTVPVLGSCYILVQYGPSYKSENTHEQKDLISPNELLTSESSQHNLIWTPWSQDSA